MKNEYLKYKIRSYSSKSEDVEKKKIRRLEKEREEKRKMEESFEGDVEAYILKGMKDDVKKEYLKIYGEGKEKERINGKIDIGNCRHVDTIGVSLVKCLRLNGIKDILLDFIDKTDYCSTFHNLIFYKEKFSPDVHRKYIALIHDIISNRRDENNCHNRNFCHNCSFHIYTKKYLTKSLKADIVSKFAILKRVLPQGIHKQSVMGIVLETILADSMDSFTFDKIAPLDLGVITLLLRGKKDNEIKKGDLQLTGKECYDFLKDKIKNLIGGN